VSDEEWSFVIPYLALVREDAEQRTHDLREVFNGLCWIVRTGSSWRMTFPRGRRSANRRIDGSGPGVFEAMVHDLSELLRLASSKAGKPSAAILDSRTLRSTRRAGAGRDTTGRRRSEAASWIPWGIS